MKRAWRKRLESRKLQASAKRCWPRLCVEELEARCQPSVTGYSLIDEVGNNVANPDWGAAPADQTNGAAIQLLRLSPVAYANGINTPSLPYGGSPTTPAMPSPRTISNDLFNQSPTLFGSPSTDVNTVDGNGLSDFGYSFGQFMDHDMDLTPDQTGQPVPSPNPTKDGNNGFPIPADATNPGDPIGSLAFSRSVFDPTTGTSTSNPRQQTNVITSYLDLSQVYGSSQVVADALRTFSGGQLKTSPGNMLPLNNLSYFTQDQLNALNMANSGPLSNDQLYAASDVRANENTELTSLTTLFVRNHNFIAQELQQENPSWTDEQLYQEARKLNIAEYQNIIYTQYLPALLGSSAPAYTGYDPTVNASISTEFSTIAYRFGHSMLNNTVARDANNGSSVGAVPLAEDFFDPSLVNPNGAIDPTTGLAATDIGTYLKGDADNSSQAVDTMAVSSVRDLLFGNGGGGEDLIARDIWRARDDGIGTYNQVRVALGLPAITNDATFGFDQITSNVQVQQELELAYAKTINAGGFAGDIDPFAGGMAEDHVAGSDMGPLFTTILADQFSRLENGDQYFYQNESFNSPQEQAILQQGSTLAQTITTNTGVTNLQANVFYAQPVFTVGSVLHVVGGSTSNDQVQINPVGTSNTGSTGVQVNATLNGVHSTTTFTQSFTSIVIFGGSGNDNIQLASSLTIPATINAGNGNDNVQLGNSSNNIVTLGNGNDNAQLGNGNNNVTLGTGNDNVQAGNGTNVIAVGAVGSTGNVQVQLGNGLNNIVTLLGNGNDHVQIGNGNFASVSVSGNGNDQIQFGNGGNDSVTLLGNGNDQVQVGNGNNDNVSVSGNGNDQIQIGNGTADFVSLVGNGNENVQTGNGTGQLHVAGTGHRNLHFGNGWIQI